MFSRKLCLGVVVLALNLGVFPARGQQDAAPHIVQPGAPGQSNKILTPQMARQEYKPPSEADVAFMQGMILHHSQAVEMTDLLRTRSQDAAVLELGQRISVSQTDEMRFMRQWLLDRGLPVTPDHGDMSGMGGMQMAGMNTDSSSMPMMPGMLTPKQMEELGAASGTTFDHLFLAGMIQHHSGALTMVEELFRNPGAGQDPQLFDFASDVDNTQQAEIDIMKNMLRERP
jgi:uncharacterized protein (DUF305 family)